jgi:hypothetical protein
VISEASERARGLLHALAFVDVNAQGPSMEFAETVAVNRGIPVAVFKTVAEARAWLLRGIAPDQAPLER